MSTVGQTSDGKDNLGLALLVLHVHSENASHPSLIDRTHHAMSIEATVVSECGIKTVKHHKLMAAVLTSSF